MKNLVYFAFCLILFFGCKRITKEVVGNKSLENIEQLTNENNTENNDVVVNENSLSILEIEKKYKIYHKEYTSILDVNFDNIDDVVTVIIDDKSTVAENEYITPTRLAIFEGNTDGTYNQPKLSIELINTLFSISDKGVITATFVQHMRNDIAVKIRYEPKYKNYMLIGKDIHYYSSADCQYTTISVNYLTHQAVLNASCWNTRLQDFKETITTKKFNQKMVSFDSDELNEDYLYLEPFNTIEE